MKPSTNGMHEGNLRDLWDAFVDTVCWTINEMSWEPFDGIFSTIITDVFQKAQQLPRKYTSCCNLQLEPQCHCCSGIWNDHSEMTNYKNNCFFRINPSLLMENHRCIEHSIFARNATWLKLSNWSELVGILETPQ